MEQMPSRVKAMSMSTRPLEPDILFALLPAEPQLQPELAVLRQLVAQAPGQHLIVDFSRVEIITSPSIGNLLLLRKTLSQQGRRLILCNVRMAAKCILRVAGLDSLFEFAADKADAQRRCRADAPKAMHP
jgi:anti-anti-sigma factor